MSIQDKVSSLVRSKKESYIQTILTRRDQLLKKYNNASTNSKKIEILKHGVLWLSQALIDVIKM